MASEHVNAAMDLAHHIEYLEEQNAKLEKQLREMKKGSKQQVVLSVLGKMYKHSVKLHKTMNAQWHEVLDEAAVKTGEEYGIHHCDVQDHIWKK